MPSYRGISQIEIVSSITDARTLLAAHSTGSALEDHLHKVSDDALSAIANAQTDEELSAAIKDSYIEANFVWIAKLLRFHAEADTDNKGLSVYKNLAKWGALSGARAMILSHVDVEIDQYIASQPDEVKTKVAFNAAAVATQVGSVSPFKAYVIEIDGLKEGSMPSDHPYIEQMCEEITDNYSGNDEFKRLMIGTITADEDAPAGIIFIATAPIAIAIADKYSGFTIKTASGTIIPPASNQPKGGNAPRI